MSLLWLKFTIKKLWNLQNSYQSLIVIKHTCFELFFNGAILLIKYTYSIYRLWKITFTGKESFLILSTSFCHYIVQYYNYLCHTVQHLLHRYKVNSVTVLSMCFVFTLSSWNIFYFLLRHIQSWNFINTSVFIFCLIYNSHVHLLLF